jgi:adenylylsulfate kinase-like enzyme
VFVLVITGPPGAGKSDVAVAVHDELGDRGVASALIELDQLERSHPPLTRERTIAHLRLLATSYRAAGHGLLIVTATLEDHAYARAVLAVAEPAEHLLVRLEAAPDTLERRIRAREPRGWSGLPTLLGSARALAESMPTLTGVDLVLSTEGAAADAVAERVIDALAIRVTGAADASG